MSIPDQPTTPKRRAGRPRLHPQRELHPVSVRLESADLAQIDEACARTGWSRNEVMRWLLRSALPSRHLMPPKPPGVALQAAPGGPAARGVGPPPPSDEPRRASAA